MKMETGRRVELIGREPELAVLREFVADRALGALILDGEAGIGKTTVWEAGIDTARAHALEVLGCRPRSAETQLSFAGLVDLLDGVSSEELPGVPSPQIEALEVALLRMKPSGRAPETRAIALGLLNALRALATRKPLLVAIDDVQWLDAESAELLAFAAHRLGGESVQFLLSRRSGSPVGLEAAFDASRRRDLRLGPLSFGATHSLLSRRLDLMLPRRVVRSIHESTQGNPLFVLEVGRTLAEQGVPASGAELPVPDALEDLLGTRVDRLPRPVRRLLLAVALGGDLRPPQLAAIADPAAVDAAVEIGVLVIDGDRVRASHPLLAAAARKRSRAVVRRELHLDLAAVVADEELQARHLALAAVTPREELAAKIAAAAGAASARGARHEAVELAEHAVRLTPQSSGAGGERLLRLAAYLEAAGDLQRVTDLLTPKLPSLASGSERARAWLLLAEGGDVRTIDAYKQHLQRALEEAQDDPVLRAFVVAKISSAVIGVERIQDAEAQALEVLPVARRGGPDVERPLLVALAWARGLQGRPVDDLCDRFDAVSAVPAHLTESPDRVAGQRLVWRGDLDAARAMFSRLLTIADERGEAVSYALQRLHLCEVALRAADWQEASRLLDEWAESGDRAVLVPPMYERCRALLEAGRGDPEAAERWAAEAIARAMEIGTQLDWLEALRARGIAALLAHEPERAAESLRLVWEHCEREGVEEPGVFPVAPELVEALAEVGELEEAKAVTARLLSLSEQQEHPWGLVTVKRCAGMIELTTGYGDEAVGALEQAAAGYEQLALRFDAARSLLALGRAQRRHRKWGAARRSLERAEAVFADLGSPGWVEETRAELARVGARRPQPSGELTPAERRVADLASDGLANKEIAQTLFVSVKTVEGHLSHVYAKLGVRSRAQLARRLAGAG